MNKLSKLGTSAPDYSFQLERTCLRRCKEERRELLETRVKSWEVFPVEEAREVKNFVETLESSMTMELDENCSAEELLEQLKHLEVGEL